MFNWDMETNTITLGQFLNSKIFHDFCSISPDGKHFATYFLDKPNKNGWNICVSVSRPPYFTAIAFKEHNDVFRGDVGGWASSNEFKIFTNNGGVVDGVEVGSIIAKGCDGTGQSFRHLDGPYKIQEKIVDVSNSSLIVDDVELMNFRDYKEHVSMPAPSDYPIKINI
jgi:hypothetical protein